jgi:predicted phage terminase large subunit-like protein
VGFPSPKQALFLTVPSLEIFYGGAARGGKSVALLAGALQYVDRPRYAALLLRRTYADLAKPEALIDVSHQWLQGTGARWIGQEHKWIFPETGATISFGYLDTEKDKYQYQSAAYQYIGFDELSQFSETQYTYLFSRLTRLADSGVPLRMRAASNPGGVGHEWVKSRFVRPVSRNGFERVFIPARLEDNPGVDQEAYRKSLSQLDYVTRMQLEVGDWDIQPAGNMFKREWFEIVEAAPAQATRTRAWDFAATEGGGDYTVGTRMSRTPSGLYYIEHVLRGQWSPRGVESVVLQTAKQDATAVRIRMEQEPGSSGKMVVENWIKLLAGYDVGAVPATGEKSTRWRPLSAQCEAGNVKLVQGPWVEPWLQEMERVPQEGQHDDQADSASIAFNELTVGQTNTAILEYYQQLYEAQLNAQKS